MFHRMRPRLARLRPRYASVVATVALFVALGGGAYAATALPANSVGTRQLKKNAVVSAKLKNNAVNGAKVAADSLTGADIRESSLAAVPAANHAVSSAAIDKVTYKTAVVSVAPGSVNTATAGCDAGQHAIGGGGKVDDPVTAFIIDTYPEAANTAWTSRAANDGAAAVNLTTYAICTSVSATG